jgi:hypothetical protein
MNVGMSVSAQNTARVARKVEIKIQVSEFVNVDVQTRVNAIASASVSCLAEIQSQLLAAGEIKIEDEPELEEDLPEEEDEGEFDSSDEDEVWNEEPDGEREIVSDPSSGIFRRDNFEIRVVKDGDAWRCEVPQSGWEGVVGVKPFGKKAVYAVSTRMQVYLLLAIWLEDHHQDFLQNGPFGFERPLCSQKKLLDENRQLREILGRMFNRKTKDWCKKKDCGKSSLSRYLENVDLVWPEGALPLKECFGG